MYFVKKFKHIYYQKFKKMGFDFNNPICRQDKINNYIVDIYEFINEDAEEYITVKDFYTFNNIDNMLMHNHYFEINFDNDNTIEYKQKRFCSILKNCLGVDTDGVELIVNSFIDSLCTLGIIKKNTNYKDFSITQIFDVNDINFSIHNENTIEIKNIEFNKVLDDIAVLSKGNFKNITLENFAINFNIVFKIKSTNSQWSLVPSTTFIVPLLDDICFLTLLEDTHGSKKPVIKTNNNYYLIEENKAPIDLIQSLVNVKFNEYFKNQEIDLHTLTYRQLSQFIEINEMLDD